MINNFSSHTIILFYADSSNKLMNITKNLKNEEEVNNNFESLYMSSLPNTFKVERNIINDDVNNINNNRKQSNFLMRQMTT